MREKLETLPLSQLREIAKENGIKSVTTIRKGNLIDLLVELYEKKGRQNEAGKEPEKPNDKTDISETGVADVSGELKVNNSKSAPSSEAKRGRSKKAIIESLSEPEVGDNAALAANVSENTDNVLVVNVSEYMPEAVNENDMISDKGVSAEEQRLPEERKSENRRTRGYVSSQDTRRGRNTSNSNASAETQGEKTASAEGQKSHEHKLTRPDDIQALDSGAPAHGILEVMPDGFGFIRCENYMPGENDVYVAPSQIRRFNLKTGDIITGAKRIKSNTEKFAALLYINSVNGDVPYVAERRPNFEDLTPVFPNEKLNLSDNSGNAVSLRIIDLLSPIGKGQRGMIVSPPKAGKTTLLKQIAHAITQNHKEMHIIILLIDERPEEVTDIKEYLEGPNVEVIYSTFDELPEHHRRVSEMVLERARRLVEHGKDVTILLDSITRLTRAYNLLVDSSGRTLSGGLDPAALHAPKRFFGAARNMREGGSLTILATALVETGSRMDDVVFEEFKGTGNMELVLNRKLSEKRIFPAIDIQRSGTRRDDLLLSKRELAAVDIIHKNTGDSKNDDAVEKVLELFRRTKTKEEFVDRILMQKY